MTLALVGFLSSKGVQDITWKITAYQVLKLKSLDT